MACSKKILGGFCRGPEFKCNLEWIAKLLAEFLGTFFYLFFGCMSCANTSKLGPKGPFEMTFNFCNVIGSAIHTFAIISGAHVNPSVSIAACVMDVVTWDVMLLYWLFQLLGGIAGFVILALLLPTSSVNTIIGPKLCLTQPGPETSVFQAFAAEFCLTFLLALFCCAIWSNSRKPFQDSLPVRFIFVYCGIILAGMYFSNASLNLARSLGPAIWHSDFNYLYIYAVGPLLAGFVAPFIWKALWNDAEDRKLTDE